MTTQTEKLANNYVWKNEYDKQYADNFKKIMWEKNAPDKWEEIKENGKTIIKLKQKS